MDRLAYETAGIANVVSVPDGAVAKPKARPLFPRTVLLPLRILPLAPAASDAVACLLRLACALYRRTPKTWRRRLSSRRAIRSSQSLLIGSSPICGV